MSRRRPRPSHAPPRPWRAVRHQPLGRLRPVRRPADGRSRRADRRAADADAALRRRPDVPAEVGDPPGARRGARGDCRALRRDRRGGGRGRRAAGGVGARGASLRRCAGHAHLRARAQAGPGVEDETGARLRGVLRHAARRGTGGAGAAQGARAQHRRGSPPRPRRADRRAAARRCRRWRAATGRRRRPADRGPSSPRTPHR